MSAHKATVTWRRQTESFDHQEYNRSHEWQFGSVTVPASAAPGYLGDGDRVDPEEALVASISSCHMLTFLAIASRKGFIVDSYHDNACGILAKNEQARLAVTRVTLQPRIEFTGSIPENDVIERMHDLAHKECFIANTVNCEIAVEPALS